MRFCRFSFYNGNYLANISPAITTMVAHRSATYRQFICDPTDTGNNSRFTFGYYCTHYRYVQGTLYGVPVLKYVLRLRPVFLTYNSIAILQMFMIIIAFVSTSYQWYNLLELTFFVTLFNSLILMTDCFSLLSDYQFYRSEIRSYLEVPPPKKNSQQL